MRLFTKNPNICRLKMLLEIFCIKLEYYVLYLLGIVDFFSSLPNLLKKTHQCLNKKISKVGLSILLVEYDLATKESFYHEDI